MSTPRERIEAYLATCDATESEPTPDVQADIRTVLSTNAGYERIIAEQRRLAVEEHRKALVVALRERAGKIIEYESNGTYHEIADDLEDGTL